MAPLFLTAAGLLVACCALGHAVLRLAGHERWRWWAPAVGYAVLLIGGAQVVRAPGHTLTVGWGLAALAAVTLAFLVWSALRAPRAAVASALLDGGPVLVVALLASTLPFIAVGHSGVLTNFNADMSAHLTTAWWLRTHLGIEPVAAIGGAVVSAGYPVGPHGLVAALTRLTGEGEEPAFAAVVVVVPVLMALVALGALREAPRPARWMGACLVGLTYLVASYLAESAFKELIEALSLLATCAALDDLVRGPARMRFGAARAAAPLGVLAAGTVYAYSYPGLLWPGAAVGAFLVLQALRRRPGRPALGAVAASALGVALTLAVLGAPEIKRMAKFAGSFFASEPRAGTGNLLHALSPAEALGTWLIGDYRRTPSPAWPSALLAALAAAALLAGLVWWWRRGRVAPPAALLAAVALWGALAVHRSIYNAAKGLLIVAPVAVLCLAVPLAAAWGTRARGSRWGAGLALARVLGIALACAAAASSFAVLRNVRIGLGPQEAELDSLREMALGHRVLFLGLDHFSEWELRGTRPFLGTGLYAPRRLPMRPSKRLTAGAPLDVDNYAPVDLNLMRWIIAPAAAYQSEVPRNFRLVRRTASFLLYRRTRRTSPRQPHEPPDEAGAVLDCSTPTGKLTLARNRAAAVRATPLRRSADSWAGLPLKPGGSASMQVRLPPGRWSVSLQYVSATGLRIAAGAMRASLPSYIELLNPYWPAGTIRTPGGTLSLRASVPRLTRLQRLLGTPGRAVTLGAVAFTPDPWTVRLRSARAACGRWVDWYRPRAH